MILYLAVPEVLLFLHPNYALVFIQQIFLKFIQLLISFKIAGAVVAGKPVDLWACGVSLYALIYGRVPFTADNLLDIYEAIRNDEVKFLPEIPIPDDLKDLLLQILDKNPSTRIKIPAIKVFSTNFKSVGK